MDSDDELEETRSWKGVPATIICINAFDQYDENVEVAHAATCGVIRQALRLSGSNFIGVCFYGTKVIDTSNIAITSVKEVFPLKLPTLDDYRELQKITVSTLDKAQHLILSELLWYCSRAFASCKRQLSSRNIVLLSRLDVLPIKCDELPTFKRVVELADSNIDIRLINISETEYDADVFYKDLLCKAYKKDDVDLPKPVWDKAEIENLIYQHAHRHLAVARLSFEISEGLAIGVGVYSLMKSNNLPFKKAHLHSETNEILTSVNKTTKQIVTEETDMDVDEDEQTSQSVPLLKSELLYYKIYGGEKVQFTDDEMKKLKNPFGPPMLKLLGFKPSSTICKEKWFLKPCYFLYPNEGVVEGSIVAFKALFEACKKRNVVAICVLCTRVNTRPIIVALSPSVNPLGLIVDIGFDVICVPFEEHVRVLPEVEEDGNVNIPEANKIAMQDILKAIQFDYKPDMFENPKVQKQYRVVEALALDDEEEDPFTDTTKPDSNKFTGLQDDLFQDLFGPFGPVAVKKPATSKDGPASKKPKMEVDESLLQTRILNDKVDAYTVAQLKDILYSKDIPELPALTGVKKKELVDLVYKHCK